MRPCHWKQKGDSVAARKTIGQSYDPALEGTGMRSGGYRFTAVTVGILVKVLMRKLWSGMDNIPKTGAVLLAVNHISYADPLNTALYVNNSGRHPRFLAKAELLKVPGLTFLMNDTGQIPVYRETREAGAALVNAVKRLEAGGCVVVYPEGTITKDPDLWPMSARTGIARLFLATGAPVIPISQWGAQNLPGKWRPWRRVPVKMHAGPPLDLARFAGREATPQLLDEITDIVMAAIRQGVGAQRDQPVPAVVWDNRRKEHVAIQGPSTPEGSEGAIEGGQQQASRNRRRSA